MPWLQVGWRPISTLRFAAACPPHFSGIQGVEFFFVTSKALFCSAIHFAEACGKSVTVGTMKCDDTEELGEQILRVNYVNRKICVCVKQCRRQSVPKSETAKAAGLPVDCAGAFRGNHGGRNQDQI
jgi:hypothetical protein